MPFRSEKQRRAMYAAASGRGTLGISSKDAKRFIEHSRKRRNPGAVALGRRK